MEKCNYIVRLHSPKKKSMKKLNKIYTLNENKNKKNKSLSYICSEDYSKSFKYLIKNDINQTVFENANSKLNFNKIPQNININNPIMVFKCNYNYCNNNNTYLN